MPRKPLFNGLLLALAFQLMWNDIQAQDPEFSQFYANPIYTNPAMTGTGSCDRGGGRAILNYRNQWPSLPGSFVTTAVSYDQHFDKIRGGLGIAFLNDVAGEGLLTTNQLSALYAFKLEVKQNVFMRFGMEAQVMQRGIDFSKLRWEDQIDPGRGIVNPSDEPTPPSKIYSPNFSTGWLLYSEKFYAGFAVHNVTKPVQSFYGDPDARLPRRFTVHGGYAFSLDKARSADSLSLCPNVLWMKQAQFQQLNLVFNLNMRMLSVGLGLRQTFSQIASAESLMLSGGYRGKRFKVAYSYDMTLDEKRTATNGSHEVSIAYQWCSNKASKNLRTERCAAFW